MVGYVELLVVSNFSLGVACLSLDKVRLAAPKLGKFMECNKSRH